MFSDLMTHLLQLQRELIAAGFSEAERAAILGAETRSWHTDMKVTPDLERIARIAMSSCGIER